MGKPISENSLIRRPTTSSSSANTPVRWIEAEASSAVKERGEAMVPSVISRAATAVVVKNGMQGGVKREQVGRVLSHGKKRSYDDGWAMTETKGTHTHTAHEMAGLKRAASTSKDMNYPYIAPC